MNTRTLIALALVAAAVTANAGEIYKCTGQSGEVLLTDRPISQTCSRVTFDYYGRVVVIAPQPSAPQVAAQ